MNFKSIILAAAVGLTSLVGVPEAQAAQQCKLFPKFSICYELTGRQGTYNVWDITVINRYWTEEMQIVCEGNRMHNWASRGGASQQEAHGLAKAFCAI